MKAVFFDWDGTLVDSLGLLASSHNHVRVALGYEPWTKEEYMVAVARSTRELYPALYGDRADEAQKMLYDYVREHHLDHLKLMPRAEALLEMLHEAGIPMAVISNKRDEILAREVEYCGWQKYFPVYIGAGKAQYDKPSAEPIRYVLERYPAAIDMKDLIYVGDTETDLKCALEAGCLAAFVHHDGPRPDLVEHYRPFIVAKSLSDLAESFRGLLLCERKSNAC